MEQIVLEVRTGAARFRVSARAGSIQRAMSITGARRSGSEVRRILPVDREPSFVGDAADRPEFVGLRVPESVAG